MLKRLFESKLLSLILFMVYIYILTWIIVAKMDWSRLLYSNLSWINNPSILLHPGFTWININLVPYSYFDYLEVMLNIVFFIPFGVFLRLFGKKFGFFYTTFLAFSLSMCYESIQYVLNIGFPDVTDVINNTLGAIIGVVITNFLFMMFKKDLRFYLNIFLLLITSYIVYEIIYTL